MPRFVVHALANCVRRNLRPGYPLPGRESERTGTKHTGPALDVPARWPLPMVGNQDYFSTFWAAAAMSDALAAAALVSANAKLRLMAPPLL